MLKVSLGLSGCLILATLMGGVQAFELVTFDLLVRIRPQAPADPRIVVVEVGEADIAALQQWPISDDQLATLLETIQQQQPRVIGLDLYRDLPIGMGGDRLAQTLRSMPHLFGVEKAVGEKVAAAPPLEELNQVALADLVLDADSKVRRGLINLQTEAGEQRLSLGAQLALFYLADEGITPEFLDQEKGLVRLGQTTIQPLQPHSGLYRGADTGGYQILLDYRGMQSAVQQVALRDVMGDRLPPDTFTDKIVFIGATAPSLNDNFLTPYNSSFVHADDPLPGVYVHATLTRQLLQSALYGTEQIRYWPDPLEITWLLLWVMTGAGITSWILQRPSLNPVVTPGWLLLGFNLLAGLGLLGIAYGCFLVGWWIPLAGPGFGLVGASVLRMVYQNHILERLATLDQLTQVANRRKFDQTLAEALLRHQPVGLILCDVDYFKRFNDFYGHLAGDACLAEVAKAIRQSVRRSDLAARYGGEEFAVILPKTHPEMAETIAERIRQQVSDLQIEHCQSEAASHVTLSCGVTSTIYYGSSTPQQLIQVADQALYLAKHQGRNSVVLKLATEEAPPSSPPSAPSLSSLPPKPELPPPLDSPDPQHEKDPSLPTSEES